jgi:hypothetical protein
MNRTFIAAVAIPGLLFGIGGLALAHARQQQPIAPPMSSTQSRTVGLMRSLNTAEAVYRKNFGHFASLDNLLYDVNYIHHNSPQVQGAAASGNDIVPDVRAVIVLAPEKDSYAVAVYDKAKDDQGYATFSDPNGLIYAGQPLQSADAAHAADINLVRAINTAEITYKGKYDRLADFDTLNAEGLLKRYSNADVAFAKSPSVLPNLQLAVLIPAAQDTWSVALHDKLPQGASYSAFSDTTGIIYEAQRLH